MGLDCTAYSHLTLSPQQCRDEDERRDYDYCYDHGHVRLWLNEHFPHAYEDLAGLDDACLIKTDKTEEFGWHAGSYGGYGVWRSSLADLSFGEPSRPMGEAAQNDFWSRIDQYQGKPFWELVNFADNEGVMGPAVSEKLYRDFVEHHDAYFARYDGDGYDATYFRNKYMDWTRAFDLARQDGIVNFH